MKYNKSAARIEISLEELEDLLTTAKELVKLDKMRDSLVISLGEKAYPEIKQYCQYAECWPFDHTRHMDVTTF